MKLYLVFSAIAFCGTVSASELTLSGDGRDSNKGFSDAYRIKPFTPYRFNFEARKENRNTFGRTLCATLQNLSVECDIDFTDDWRTFSNIVMTPSGCAEVESPIKFTLWQVNGNVLVRNWSVVEQRAMHGIKRNLTLGDGEALLGNRYFFNDKPVCFHHNHSRPLFSWRGTVGLNSDRYPIGDDGEIVWRHDLSGRRFLSGRCGFETKYFGKGELCMEVSSDGRKWTEVGRATLSNRHVRVPIPASLFPMDKVFVRVRGINAKGIQMREYFFDGMVDGPSEFLKGETVYVDVNSNATPPTLKIPEYHKVGYGELLPGTSKEVALWRADSGWKVPRERVPPTAVSKGLEISMAANEAEAVQLVATPLSIMSNVMVKAEVPSIDVEVLKVSYVCVDKTVDGTVPGLYPDPLPPHTSPMTLKAGENQPFWIKVKAPKGTPRGIYGGWVTVAGDISDAGGHSRRFEQKVPLAVKVYGFELPDRMTCRTLFGFWYTFVDRYHGLTKHKDRLRMYDRYMAKLSEYHLSASNGATEGLRSWYPKWVGDEPVFNWKEWDEGIARGFEKFNFSAMRMPRRGLGLGHKLGPDDPNPELGGVKRSDPRYEIRLAKLLKGIQDHLEAKGWLDRTYFYPYDEPMHKDFADVMSGFATLAKYAPKLRRFVTVNVPPSPALFGGPQVWCPLPTGMDTPFARERQRLGEEFWLYLCCNPISPYVTLFIDHPGVELRTWLWQSWAENVKGVLVWTTDYWTTRSMYPDWSRPQNPYVDAQTWALSGSSRWGCGDGRILYPPESVFEDVSARYTALRPGPNFDDPVGSVRGEMLRDGIEDYEYFVVLKKLDPSNPLLKVPADVSKSLSEFSKSPDGIRRHRERLAAEIEKLMRRN